MSKQSKRVIGKIVARKRLTQDELDLLTEYRGVKEVSISTGAPIEDIDFYWDKSSSDYSVNIKNRFYKPRGDSGISDIDFNLIFKDKLKPVKVEPKKMQVGLFDRLVYSDTHIGMNPNPDGYSLYGGKWDEEELDKRLQLIINEVVRSQKSNILYIDDLGDYMDGWNGQTTRGGHDLPQNMDNQQAFDIGLSFKIRMIDTLFQFYERIYCHNICDDNHAGAFAYNVNSAFKSYIELKYNDNIEVVNQRKFIDHYKVGRYVFILTHGKDSKDLKFGFKPVLNDKQIEKIHNYITDNYLHTKGVVIEFSKGDSHQYLFDNASSDLFNYYNYPALSPSSRWVQTNFKKGKSGFIFFNYYESEPKCIQEHLFDWVG